MWVSGSTSSIPRAEHLLDHVGARHRAEGVEDRLRPRLHLLRLVAGQVAELLAADGEQRPEDDDLLVLAPLEHRLEPGAQRQRRLAGAGAAAERDDADVGVEQQVERDPLLGRAAAQAERLAVAADQPHLLVGRHPAQRAAALGQQHQAGVARQLAGRLAGRATPSSYSASRSIDGRRRPRSCPV